jgi:hypothetical protein
VKNFPEIITYLIWEVAFCNSFADLLLQLDKVDEILPLAEANISRATQLLKDHPELWYLNSLLMESNQTLALALRRSGKTQQADMAEDEAENHRSKLRETSPVR